MVEPKSVCLKICGVSGMNETLLNGLLDSAGEFRRRTGCITFPRYFSEPATRSDFVDIIEKQFRLDLAFDGFWFPTSGKGFSSLSDSEWKRLAATGFSWLRLAFHGTEKDHDRFLQREGAWKDLARTARKAEENGIDWFPVVFLNRYNADRYEEIRAAVEKIGSPSLATGWMVPNWQNNPEFDKNRVSYHRIAHLAGERSIWKSERSILKMIDSDEVLASSRVFHIDSGIFYLGCLPCGDVFFAGGCHGEPFTEHRERMVLGSFPENRDISFFLEQAVKRPPEQVKVLSGITFGQLAELYGNADSDTVYRIQDLVVNKWGSMFLKNNHGSGS